MSLYIVDGYNMIFRAYYSLPSLTNSDNTPVGAVYGFTNMLIKLIEDANCEMLLIALDSEKNTFRKILYPEYKSNRIQIDNALRVQFPIIREAIEALGIKYIEIPGFEADDIIATYTTLALNNGLSVTIVSSDKDLIQLMHENVRIYDPLKKIVITPQFVEEKYGIHYSQMVDYLSLVGDQSDNIPGVKNIGPKTAAKLPCRFKNLEEIYKNIDVIEPIRIKNLLKEQKKEAFFFRQLIQLEHKVDIVTTLDQLKFNSINVNSHTLKQFLRNYGFKSINTKKILVSSPHNQEIKDTNINTKYISFDNLKELVDEIEEFGQFFFHVNKTDFSCYFGSLLYKIDLCCIRRDITALNQDNINILLIKQLRNIFEDPSINKICFDFKPMINLCLKYKVNLKSYDDIGLLYYVLHTGKLKISIEKLIKELSNNYQEQDAFCISILYRNLKLNLAEKRNFEIYETIEKPLMFLVAQIENKGINISKDFLLQLGIEFLEKLNLIENQIFSLSPEIFNIGSPKQIGNILFDKLKLDKGKKNKKNSGYVTDAETLENLASSGVILAKKILQWRHYKKLISTYIHPLKKDITEDGRIHTTFSLTATSTGRLSSYNPNLQNIPVKSDDGNKIRKAFIAKKNHLMVSGDYSQIELRILADIANITYLRNVLLNKQDIHAITASQIFNIPLENVNIDLRRRAKAINFGIIYGQSAYGLSNTLNITREEARSYIQLYFKQYPGIKSYMENTIQYARQYGYVKTLMGRRCYIKNINSSNYNLRKFSERAAINAPIQGTASEIIKKAMLNLNSDLKKYLVLQIHDELLFEIPSEMVEQYCQIIKRSMINAFNLSVPLDVQIGYGKSWYETKNTKI